jgi:hypothetical protein
LPYRDAFDLRLKLLTFGDEFWVVPVSIVNQSAVVGVEGLGFDRATMGSDGLGELVDAVEESIVPHITVMLDIDDDAWSFVIMG